MHQAIKRASSVCVSMFVLLSGCSSVQLTCKGECEYRTEDFNPVVIPVLVPQ